MTSIQVFATPTRGLVRSSSVNPTALSIARAGARPGPSSRVRLLCVRSIDMVRGMAGSVLLPGLLAPLLAFLPVALHPVVSGLELLALLGREQRLGLALGLDRRHPEPHLQLLALLDLRLDRGHVGLLVLQEGLQLAL